MGSSVRSVSAVRGSRLFFAAMLAVAVGGARPAAAGELRRAPYLQSVSDDAATVYWRTKTPSLGFVRFGVAPDALVTQINESEPRVDHAVKLTGLVAATRYFYAVGQGVEILAGGDGLHAFRTPPADGAAVSARVLVLGGSGSASPGQRRVRDAFLDFTGTRGTDLWLMLGDNAYQSGTAREYRRAVFGVYRELLASSCLWPALGNHDLKSADAGDESGPFFDVFWLPRHGEAGGEPSMTEAYWSFDHGDAHFVCLDSGSRVVTAGDAMVAWLEADLARAKNDGARWLVAYWHHAPYSKGTHDSDDDEWMTAMRKVFVPRLEEGGVDLVLAGHSHDYERSMLIDGHTGKSSTFAPSMVEDGGNGKVGGDGAYRKPTDGLAPHEGAVYVTCGCSGKLESGGDLDHPAMLVNDRRLGSLVLDIHGAQLDVRFLGDDGRVHDRFTIVKGDVVAVPIEHLLVTKESTWRCHDQGHDLGAAWAASGFDDLAWPSLPGVLGYGSKLVDSEVGYGGDKKNKFATTYFRRTFALDFLPAAIESLRLSVRADDGFVAWLNGVEVARRGFEPGQRVAFDTFSKSRSARRPVTIEIGAFKSALVLGENVLAIEVHQAGPASKDLVFDASLDADAFVAR